MSPAKRNADWVMKKHGAFFERLIAEAVALAETPGPIDPRARRVLEITDDLAAKVAPKAVCRRGCAHCCYQSVIVSDWEAERIGRYTGRNAAKVPALTPGSNILAMRARFAGVACPFLVKNECSIYAVRPLACRTHFNMSRDPELCDIKTTPGGRVPYFNFRELTMVHCVLFLNAGCSFADVRDYFPGAVN